MPDSPALSTRPPCAGCRSVVRARLASQGCVRCRARGHRCDGGTPQAEQAFASKCPGQKPARLIRAEEGAIFCDASGTIVMEVKDIDPTGNLAVGAKDDPGKLCKQCEAPWNKALGFQATKIEKAATATLHCWSSRE